MIYELTWHIHFFHHQPAGAAAGHTASFHEFFYNLKFQEKSVKSQKILFWEIEILIGEFMNVNFWREKKFVKTASVHNGA